MNLTIDEKRIDDDATVVDSKVSNRHHTSRLDVYFDDGDVGAEGECRTSLIGIVLHQKRFAPLGGRARNRSPIECPTRDAGPSEPTVADHHNVFRGCFK